MSAYWILVPVTGVVAGLLAVLLVTLLRLVHELCWTSSQDVGQKIEATDWLTRVLILTGGGLLVALYVHCRRRSSDLELNAGVAERLGELEREVEAGSITAPRAANVLLERFLDRSVRKLG